MISESTIAILEFAAIQVAIDYDKLMRKNIYDVYISGLLYGIYVTDILKCGHNLEYTLEDMQEEFNKIITSKLN